MASLCPSSHALLHAFQSMNQSRINNMMIYANREKVVCEWGAGSGEQGFCLGIYYNLHKYVEVDL